MPEFGEDPPSRGRGRCGRPRRRSWPSLHREVVHERRAARSAGRRARVRTVTVVRIRCRSSSSVPERTARPARMIVTVSQSFSTSARMWLDSSTAAPRCGDLLDALLKRLLHQRIQARCRLVEDVELGVGARTRRRSRPSAGCPWSRCGPSCAGRVRNARSAGRGAGCRRRCRAAAPGSRWPASRSGWATASHRLGHRRSGGAASPRRATDRRRAAGRVPPSARSRPSSTRMVVDLPAPFGPRNPAMSPGATVRSRPSSALVRPKDFDRSSDFDSKRRTCACVSPPRMPGRLGRHRVLLLRV